MTNHPIFTKKIYNTFFSCLTNGVSQIPVDKISRTKLEQVLSPLHSRLTPVGKLNEEDCKMIWSNVNNSTLTNDHKDLAWKVAHQCLPTRAFLERRNCTNNAKCPRPSSGENETVVHLFWSCPTARGVWSLVSPLLQALYEVPRCYENIAHGCLKRNQTTTVEKWRVVINCVEESLWKARNVSVMKRYCIPRKIVLRMILNGFNDYILTDKSTTDKKTKLLMWKVPKTPLFDSSLCVFLFWGG